MTDNKAALDELNAMRMRLKAIDGTYDWEDSYKAIEAALTTPPAPTVMGDEIQKAFLIADARDADVMSLDFENVFWACGILARALRAATRAHDAGLVKALEDGLSELSCTCDERFMLDTECPVCRMTKALAAHKASAHGGKEGR